MLRYLKLTAISLLGFSLPLGFASANEEGEALFGQCRACHQVGPDAKHQFGPVLNGVMNRSAKIADDYDYSDAFKKASDAGLAWDETTMSEFLASPLTYISGTKMAFPGIPEEADRKKLIDYLALFDAEGNSSAEPLADDAPMMEHDAKKEPRPLARDAVVPDHGVLHLGRIAHEEEVQAWDIDVRPDGTGLPIGSGNALAGVDLYDAQCAACHGDFGEGMGRWPILAGGHDSLTDDRPEKTVGSYWPYLSTVYDYIRRAMPFGNARSLSDDDVYAITAYILYLNDEVDEDFELSSENFTEIRLPNEANFIADTRVDEPFKINSLDEICMNDCFAEPAKVTQRAQVLDVTPDQ